MCVSQLMSQRSCPEVDEFLLTYVILKLRLIKEKYILFVNDVGQCYRLKLFLVQLLIESCVLSSELPLNSRYAVFFVACGIPLTRIIGSTRQLHRRFRREYRPGPAEFGR